MENKSTVPTVPTEWTPVARDPQRWPSMTCLFYTVYTGADYLPKTGKGQRVEMKAWIYGPLSVGPIPQPVSCNNVTTLVGGGVGAVAVSGKQMSP